MHILILKKLVLLASVAYAIVDKDLRLKASRLQISASGYWHTATSTAWYTRVKQHRPQVLLGWVTILVCQFLLIVRWMRL